MYKRVSGEYSMTSVPDDDEEDAPSSSEDEPPDGSVPEQEEKTAKTSAIHRKNNIDLFENTVFKL